MIYSYVTDGVREVIRVLETQAEDAEDEAVQSEIVAGLNLMQAKVAGKQEELRASANWKEFTVALYGETNAGKSTIIESLRIYLGESTKVEQRGLFDEMKATQGLGDEVLQATRDAIETAHSDAALASSRGKQIELEGLAQLQALEQEKKQGEEQALAARAVRPWWKKLLGIFKRAEEDVTIREIQARIDELRRRQQQELQQVSAELSAAEAALASAEDALSRRMRAMPQLLDHADGAIIGDGRPDFTRVTRRYTFNIGAAPFVMLDVPGIEGGEDGVKAHIDKAVQTAHAVFYVTGKAARPQHGDKGEGTLEKIKRHLGPQTEVWAVFNKRVTAPMPFRNSANLFAHDADGMADLEQGLREALGANYKGVLSVSAYPAFLAVADRLPPAAALAVVPPGTQDRNAARSKFLSEFDPATLLDRTGFAAMANHLASMAVDAPRKIQLANVYKANQSLQEFVTDLERHAVSMESHARKVTTETTAVQGQVDIAALKLGASLRSDASDALRAMATGVRKQIYARIESGISNDELKQALEESLELHASSIQREVGEKFRESVTQFQSAITKAAERFQKHLRDLGQVAGSQMREISGPTFVLDLRVDNGVSVVGLVTTAIGAVALVFTGPAGWVVITFSALGVTISLLKAIASAVNASYRKSQQCKAVNENLSSAMTSLKKDMEASEKAVLEAVESACTEAKKRLGGPQRNVKAQAAVLRLSAKRLRALGNKIETTMA